MREDPIHEPHESEAVARRDGHHSVEKRPAGRSPLAEVQAALTGAMPAAVVPRVREAAARAHALRAAAPGDPEVERAAAVDFAADVLVALGAEGALSAPDVRRATGALVFAARGHRAATDLLLYRAAVTATQLRELPPLVSTEIQLTLLLHLGIVDDVSVWWRDPAGEPDCLLAVGRTPPDRKMRREAQAVLRGRQPLRTARRPARAAVPLHRFSRIEGAVVATPIIEPARADAFLATLAAALEPHLEREFLLERNSAREHAVVAAGERRLTRVAFDLHDGPVQDVLALAGELRALQHDLDPFVAPSHRELAWGRFDDAVARLSELDRSLRAVSHSLEGSSILSRPIGESVHRAADAFASRSGIDVDVEVLGDVDGLTDSQRIVIFRAIQEALSNVREHSGATSVLVEVRGHRAGVDVAVTDDGCGFDVTAALARAAQLGRLGMLGIGERVRLLGGSFEIDSRPGGPTALRIALPRWEPLAHAKDTRSP